MTIEGLELTSHLENCTKDFKFFIYKKAAKQ